MGCSPWGCTESDMTEATSQQQQQQQHEVYCFPGGSAGKEIRLQCRRSRFDPWLGKIPWRRDWLSTPVFLPGEFHGQRSLAGYSIVHGVARSRTGLSDFTFTFHFPTLEKEMAAHFSVLAWRIPGTAEPGGLPSMGSHRVGHD